MCSVCAGSWSERPRRRKVRFQEVVQYYDIPAYSTIFGKHPKSFHFTDNGSMIDACRSSQSQVTWDSRELANVKGELMSVHCRQAYQEDVIVKEQTGLKRQSSK